MRLTYAVRTRTSASALAVYCIQHAQRPCATCGDEGVGRIFFDQCVFGAPTPKATQLIASNALMKHLSPRFSERFCGHPPGTDSASGFAATPLERTTPSSEWQPTAQLTEHGPRNTTLPR
eukprot:4444098-Pleurochrysis_carterae.AAC.1